MAMATRLQSVTAAELAGLRDDPDSIDSLASRPSYWTHFAATINYFLSGNAYPGEKNGPLWPVLDGAESLSTVRMECGSFGVVPIDHVARLATLLADIDIEAVAAAAGDENLDVDSLINDEELEDLEIIAAEELPGVLTNEVTGLVAFYQTAARDCHAVVMYTT